MDNSLLLLAARCVRRQAKQLHEQLDGVRKSEDIEYVHRARVATRRLRAALRMFSGCFGDRKVKRWRTEIRRAASGLGEARDRDVQSTFLCEMMQKITIREYYPGVARLLVGIEHEREQLHPKVCKAVSRLRGSGVIDEMIATARRILGDFDSDEVGLRSATASRVAREQILGRLAELESFADSLFDPEQKTRHHAMRIAAKHLRYTLEICNPVFEKRLDDAIGVTKGLQSLLGDLHDCDVWHTKLEDFCLNERKRLAACYGNERRFVRLAAGIVWFREERLARRTELFSELTRMWSELIGKKIWDNLRQIVEIADEPSMGASLTIPSCTVASEGDVRREAAPR